MIPIDKRIDWNAIRAEYIGGATYRALSEKYGVNKSSILDRCKSEGWKTDKEQAVQMTRTKAVQATAQTAAENATIAAEVQRRLLLRLKRTEARFPMDATEIKATEGGKTVIYRLRDLTSAYKDIAENIMPSSADELLKSARALLEGVDSAIN